VEKGSYYVDLRTVPSSPEAYHSVMGAYVEMIGNGVRLSSFDAIGGIPTAGLAFSSPVSHQLHKPMIYARKEEKRYVRQKRTEEVVQARLEDTTHRRPDNDLGSIIQAISATREWGVKADDALVSIDRLEGAGQPRQGGLYGCVP